MPRSNYITHDTLDHLMRGESWAFQQVVRVLHNGMVNALRDGDEWIHAPWVEVARWAGVSVRSIRRVVERLREKGWVREASGHRLALVFGRVPAPAKSAKVAPCIYYGKTLREEDGTTHPEPVAPSPAAVPVACAPSGGDESPQEPEKPQEAPKVPSGFTEAVGVLVSAGADRAGAVKAVKAVGKVDVEAIRRIVAAVDAMPSKPYRRGGLLCAAVSRPELGRKLVRDAEWQARKQGTVKPPSVPQEASKLPKAPVSPWEASLAAVRSWEAFGVDGPDDLRFLMSRNPAVTAEAVRVAAPAWGEWL